MRAGASGIADPYFTIASSSPLPLSAGTSMSLHGVLFTSRMSPIFPHQRLPMFLFSDLYLIDFHRDAN
jgi:hypothetical protein